MIVLKCPVADAMGGEAQQWFRFNRHIYNDYWPMNLNHWEAIVFVPRRDVFFYGFGVFAHKDGLDLPVDVQWHIDGEKHEMFHVTLNDADADPEHKWHSIDIRVNFDQ